LVAVWVFERFEAGKYRFLNPKSHFDEAYQRRNFYQRADDADENLTRIQSKDGDRNGDRQLKIVACRL
jgi:hypothetical protein